jgi:hypothetical protein
MDALKIALETTFVGVLALPWLALAAQLFFPGFSLPKMSDYESWFTKLQSIKSETVGYAIVGLLSVAMVYTLGASISRLAQDFFSDDDLPWHLPTEDEIRASVYCNNKGSAWVVGDPGVSSQQDPSGLLQVNPQCTLLSAGSKKRQRDPAQNKIQQIFHLQEAALLLAGEDKVSRIRLLHQQIMVLRGAAFDGVITCLLCLLSWSATLSWRWRWFASLLLLLYSIYAMVCNHFQLCQFPLPGFRYEPDDPPLMELTLLFLACGGAYVAAKGRKGSWPQGTGLVSFLLTALAYSGWYWTEIRYDQLVIYSFYAGHYLKLSQ